MAVQHLADGGLVGGVKRMLGLTPADPARAAALAEYRANAAREKEAAKAASAPAQSSPQAISQYSGMTAMQRREKEQGLADGGLVARMKSADAGPAPFGSRGLNQLRELAPKMQAMGFHPARAEPAANDRGVGGLKAMIPQMEAMGFKQAQAAADGGIIRGPGTGTSDSIPDEMEPGTFIMPADSTQALGLDDEATAGEKVPVRVSNGEYELPPERVQAVGAAVLEAIKGMTHTPAQQGGGLPEARGFKPKGEQPQQFFAEGGRVKSPDEQERLRNQTAMYVQGAQAAAASRPPEQAPSQPVQRPAVAAPAPQSTTSPSGLYMQDRTNELREQASAGNYAQAAGTAARTAVQGLGMYGIELADKATTPLVNAAAGFGRGLFGGGRAAEPSGVAGAPTSVTTGVQPAAAPAPSAAVPAAPTAATTVPPSAEDKTAALGPSPMEMAPPRNGGQISAQNMAAAESLAQRDAQRSVGAVQQPAAAGFPGVTAPVARNSSNDWAARNELRNAKVSADSITNTERWGGKGAQNNPAVLEYQAMLKNDLALRGAQPGMDTEAMRQNAGLQREGVQQAGATTRTAMQEEGANTREAGRAALAGQELGLKREAQGFQTRAAAQLEALQNAYTAEKDPAKQAAIARQIRGLQGKADPAEWAVQVTPATKNADGSTTEGSVIRYNKATGQAERVDVGQSAQTAQQFTQGAVYRDAAGNTRRWNGTGWEKA